MAYLRKPKNSNKWHIVYHVAGKRREWSTKTSNHGIAKGILKKWEHERLLGHDPRPTETPVARLLRDYAVHLRTQTGRTRKKGPQTDLYRLATWFGPVCDALKENPQQNGHSDPKRGRRIKKGDPRYVAPLRVVLVEEITSEMAGRWLSTLATRRNLTGKTLNEYREILSRFLGWAMRRGVRLPGGKNPLEALDRFRVETKPIRFLTLDQIDVQLSALDDAPMLKTMVATLIYAGLRLGELLWLTQQDVDLDQGYLRIRRKTVLGSTWMPKTGRDRAVPISPTLHEHLNGHIPPAGTPWYFVTPQGCQWDTDGFGGALRSRNQKLQLPWTALDFRHTFGSHLAMKGETLYKISQLMGNSPEVCRKHYAALLPESLVDAVEFRNSPEDGRPRQAEETPPVVVDLSAEMRRRGLRIVGLAQ